MRCSLVTAAALVLTCAAGAHAGAWTRGPGSFYAKVALSTLRTSSFYTPDGDRISTANFSSTSLDLYAEYGLGRRLTGVVRFPIVKSASFETTETESGIGDLGLELKYGLRFGTSPLALGIGVELPTGDESGAADLDDQAGSPGGFIRLPTGDGEFNTRIILYASHSFHSMPTYVSAEAGYNLRSENFTDEYLFGLQAGYRVAGRLWLNANLRGVGPVTDPDRARSLEAANGFGEGVQYVEIGIGAACDVVPHVGLTFDVLGAAGRITNVYSGTRLVFGLATEY